jgi:hypothetical protein
MSAIKVDQPVLFINQRDGVRYELRKGEYICFWPNATDMESSFLIPKEDIAVLYHEIQGERTSK